MLNSYTILTLMLLLPVLGGLAVLALPPAHAKRARPLAMGVCLATLAIAILAASWFDWTRASYERSADSGVQLSLRLDWIRSLGAQYFVGVDGLSMPLVLLTAAMGVVACAASYGIAKSVKGYFSLLLFLLAGTLGVFVSLDLLVFYIFLELSLVPAYFLIGIWGGPRKEYAAIKYFLYSLLGSMALLIAILGIRYHTRGMGGGGGGVFDVITLATDSAIVAKFAPGGAAGGFATAAFWLLFAGFAIKIPIVPLHTWLPDALVEAPTPIAMFLSAVVVNIGAYGLLRLNYAILPHQAAQAWFYVALLGVVTIAYGALVALAQKDFKRLVAYCSISQMGFVVLGISVMTPMAATGAMFQMIAHGVSAAMLFFVVGVIFDRAHHRDIPRLGGLWAQMPLYTGWAAVAFLAAMGLPGLCGFVGQLLVLLGTFSAAHGGETMTVLMKHSGATAYRPLLWLGGIAVASLVVTAGYLLWTLQRVYMGAAKPEYHNFPGLTRSEKWILIGLGLAAIVLGVLPMLVLDHIHPAIEGMMRLMPR